MFQRCAEEPRCVAADSLATEPRCAVRRAAGVPHATVQRYAEAQRCVAALKHAARRLVKAHAAAVRLIGALLPEDAAYMVALRPGPASTKRR